MPIKSDYRGRPRMSSNDVDKQLVCLVGASLLKVLLSQAPDYCQWVKLQSERRMHSCDAHEVIFNARNVKLGLREGVPGRPEDLGLRPALGGELQPYQRIKQCATSTENGLIRP